MSLRINNNVEAFNAHRQLVGTSAAAAKSMERLSSGYRINRASDDAAGLAISEKMRAQIRGLAQNQRNIGDGVSLVQTAEGALSTVHNMLQRVRELAVQYKNGTLSTTNQAAIQSEVNQLASEIERIGQTTQFNGICLLNSSSTTVSFQVGANDGEVISVGMISLGSTVGSTYFALTTGGTTDISQIDAFPGDVMRMRLEFFDEPGGKTRLVQRSLRGTSKRHRASRLLTPSAVLRASARIWATEAPPARMAW